MVYRAKMLRAVLKVDVLGFNDMRYFVEFPILNFLYGSRLRVKSARPRYVLTFIRIIIIRSSMKIPNKLKSKGVIVIAVISTTIKKAVVVLLIVVMLAVITTSATKIDKANGRCKQ